MFKIINYLLLLKLIDSHQRLQNNICSNEIESKLSFQNCLCEPYDNKASVSIRCKSQTWNFIPKISKIFEEENIRPTISAFYINNGRLSTIKQDAFKGENLEIIDLSNNKINSLNVNAFRGLENNLLQLNFDRNELSIIPSWAFTYLHHLEHLSLRENEIIELGSNIFGETRLKNLQYLHLDKNRISILPQKAFNSIQLQVLTLSNNKIKFIGKQSLPDSLWFLDLKNNILNDIPYLSIKDLKRLKTLDLEGNTISSIKSNNEVIIINENEINLLLANNKIKKLTTNAFNSFKKFNRLDLSYNQISEINENAFRSVEKIEHLDLSYNFISNIAENTFAKFNSNLKNLNLEENHLNNVPQALIKLTALQILNMNNNKLSILDEKLFIKFKSSLTELLLAFNQITNIPSNVLQGMTKLRFLDLSKNHIEKIEKMAFGWFKSGSASAGINLLKLNLAGNSISEITNPGAFLYVSSLTYLDLSFNKINNITHVAIERLESLESLFLQNNKITEFPRNALSSLNKLRHLSLDHNQIFYLPNYCFQWLVHLERLSLSQNQIHTLNAKTFYSTSAIQIKWLNLGFNRINTMHTGAFENLLNIEQLFLNNNRLTILRSQIISSLRNLRFLTLAYNQINETQEKAFDNLPQLESLSLKNNRLRNIKESIFNHVPNLARLDLSYNQIESFDLDFLKHNVQRLKFLDLSHNVIRKLDIFPAKKSILKLEVQHNQLEFIDNKMFRGLEKLLSLDLSYNDLIEVDSGALVKSPRLTRIILSHNNLQNIWRNTFVDQKLIHLLDLSSNTLNSLEIGIFGKNNVVKLNLSHNNFSFIPLRALYSIRHSLSVLDLSFNNIRSLEWHNFDGLNNITILKLMHNKIEVLEEEVFRELTLLKLLDLSSNPIATWNPHVFLSLNPNIEYLNLANTGLFSLPKLNTRGLKMLNISYNKIYEIFLSDVESLKKLSCLDLAYNNLLDLKASAFENLHELRHLNLSGNGIRVLQTEHLNFLNQLETLHLGNMEALVRIPEPKAFSVLQHLKNFYIYNLSQVINYDVKNLLNYLPPLKQLSFEYKSEKLSATVLENVDLRLLRKLTISGSNINEIDSSAFERLRGFRIKLTIRDTKINSFPSEIIERMGRISFLNLALVNNRIKTLNPFIHKFATKPPILNRQGTILESINLKGNPLECDCRLEWLSEWINYYSADNSEQWSNAKQFLLDTKCTIITSGKINKQISLLEMYDRLKFDEINSFKSNRIEFSKMECDAEGRLLSTQNTNRLLNKCQLLLIVLLFFFSINRFFTGF